MNIRSYTWALIAISSVVAEEMFVQLNSEMDTAVFEAHMHLVDTMTDDSHPPTVYNLGDFYAYWVYDMTDAEMKFIESMPEVLITEKVQPQYSYRDRCVEQNLASNLRNLEHVSKRTGAKLDGSYRYPFANDEDTKVDLYIIDTGIDTNHTDFNGRSRFGYDATNEPEILSGHGTNVAGFAMSSTYGTAKQANSISVKALAGPEGAGNSRITMDALIWVAKEVEANMGNGRQSVINMSLGGPRTNLLNSLVDTMVDQLGIHIIVAAGNDNLNACNFSPASAERVITVGASNGNDRRAEFSNFGSCVDIFAPGQNVLSTAPDQGLNRGSGTSYAAPMVAGMVVNLLSSFPDMTPAEVRAYLIQDATPDALSNIGVNSPNLLAYQDCDVLLQSELAVPNAGGSEGDGTNIASVDDGNSTLIIGVAAAVAVALLIALIALVLCCRKKKAPAKGMSTKNSWNRSDEPLASMGATGSV